MNIKEIDKMVSDALADAFTDTLINGHGIILIQQKSDELLVSRMTVDGIEEFIAKIKQTKSTLS